MDELYITLVLMQDDVKYFNKYTERMKQLDSEMEEMLTDKTPSLIKAWYLNMRHGKKYNAKAHEYNWLLELSQSLIADYQKNLNKVVPLLQTELPEETDLINDYKRMTNEMEAE